MPRRTVIRTPATAASSSRNAGTMAIVPPTFAPNPGQPDATTVNSATAAAAATAWPRPARVPSPAALKHAESADELLLPAGVVGPVPAAERSEEHTSELQSRPHLVCRLLLEKKKKKKIHNLIERKKKKKVK